MLTEFNQGGMPRNELDRGLLSLKKRQRNFMLLFVFTSSLFIATLIAGVLQQDLVASFFGLSAEVKQLHVPVSAQAFAVLDAQPNYFSQLLAWVGWLIVKVIVSFIGAFWVVALLKKIRFFYVRFQSFVLKFVGWLIAFIMLWSGLTYLQYDLKDDQDDVYHQLTQYEQHISESAIYQQLNASQTAKTVEAYLLAQTALLHQPADVATAKPYVEHLVQAEQQSPSFNTYGFKAETLWSMQQQIYQKSITASTQALTDQVVKMQTVNQYVQTLLWVVGGIWLMLAMIFLGLAQYFSRRFNTIWQRIGY